MKRPLVIVHFLFIVISLVCLVSRAVAAVTTITPSGSGTFTVQGSDMDGVAGIDLFITYDTTLLASPSVTQGHLVSGALMAANTNNPGSIKIAIIDSKPFSGSGTIATITFASQNGTGGITSVRASAINSKGASVAMQANVTGETSAPAPGSTLSSTPGVPFGQPVMQQQTTQPQTTQQPAAVTTAGSTLTMLGSVSMPNTSEQPATSQTSLPQSSLPQTTLSQTTQQPATATTSGYMPTILGAVSMPVDTSQQQAAPPFPKQKDQAGFAAPPPEPSRSISATQSAVENTVVPSKRENEEIAHTVHTSKADRFRTFAGEKSPPLLAALFVNEVATTIRQQPAIVVSDGVTTATIRVELPPSSTSPNFALNGAKHVSIRKEQGDGTWVIEVLPHGNAVRATVTILSGNSSIDYPLTVVPPVHGMKFSDTDFETFLKDSGSPKPKFDLNGDGKHDYIDDYIYTGHYLLQKEKEKVKPQKAEK
ncbi:MAG: cohesin domain-containing protein [Desulfuromonadales bacterium]